MTSSVTKESARNVYFSPSPIQLQISNNITARMERRTRRLDPPPSSILGQRRNRSTYGLRRDYGILEREKKVSTALQNRDFCSQLERILQGQIEGKNEPKTTRLSHNQWLEDRSSFRILTPQGDPKLGKLGLSSGEIVIPINDLSSTKYSLAEREIRCKLAAVYRLADMFGWNQLIYNHITVRKNPYCIGV